MIVQSLVSENLEKVLKGKPVVFGDPWETNLITVEPSKSGLNKLMIGLTQPTEKSYHKSAIGSNVCCHHAFVELIYLIRSLDSKAQIICAGVKCDDSDNAWIKSLETLLPCNGDKNKLQKEKLGLFGQNLNLKPLVPGKLKKKTKVFSGNSEILKFPGDYPNVDGTLETIPIAGKSVLVRSVHGAVYNFYALEEASLGDNLPAVFLPRYKEFLDSTARTMFDYLATICLSEARHAFETAWDVYGVNNENKSRSNAWTLGRAYNPRYTLKICEHLFKHAGFPGGYGGKAWANIAHCAGRYFDLPVKSWLDHVVDLAHNGGLAFNKGVFWFNPTNNGAYIHMLDRRKKGSIFDDVNSGYGMQTFGSTHGEQKWLLYCAGLMDEPGPKCPPLKWGTQLMEVTTGVLEAGGDNSDGDDAPEEVIPSATRIL